MHSVMEESGYTDHTYIYIYSHTCIYRAGEVERIAVALQAY